MKLTTIFAVTLSMFCLAGNAMAADPVSTYVEFSGPWSFIPIQNNRAYCGNAMDSCIVAISPSGYHKPAVFNGAKKAQAPLDTGVYILTMQSPQADSIGGGGRKAVLVDGGAAKSSVYTKLIKATNPAQNRYAVILPYVPCVLVPVSCDSFEEPNGKAYSELASISDTFIDPNAVFQEKPVIYTKGLRIHYRVSDLSVSLTGNPDSGGTKTVQETAPVTFSMEPLDTNFRCDVPARRTFRDMNDLLLKNQQRKFVDFPDYTKGCRLVDPQRFEDTLPSIFTFSRVDSDNINIPTTLELIKTLDKLNDSLNLQYAGANHQDIQMLLKDTSKYLQENQQTRLKNNNQKGIALANRLNKIMRIINKSVDQDKDKDKDQKTLAWGIGMLINIVAADPGSGANCKAPMMGLTVQ